MIKNNINLILTKAKYRFVLSGLCVIILFFLSTMPAHEEDRPEWLITYHFDKIAHLIAYAGLSFLIMRDIGQKWQTLAFCLIYGLIIEIVQGKYFETRHFDILDLFANIIGAIVGIRIFYIIKKKLNE